MEKYFSSGAWFVQILGLSISIVTVKLYTKESHNKSKKSGGLSLIAQIFLLLPWYVCKSVFILMGLLFIILPIFSF
ncbi:hypothetical protein [Bacillus sp. AFS088145]|uniref:hypothetical protein n=1 Tax=Bacillus sp. AFS088145 TaxID=2033514 RepID=UPI000BF7EC38|nr:hypothetical protein [Bacillus sp. AFS088145]PFH80796.1 hypothetical protein COI44_23565 [Bacillus sp. AFS088145]